MKKALVTFDFKKDSKKLVQFTKEWAKSSDGELILLHVELMEIENRALIPDNDSSREDKSYREFIVETMKDVESEFISEGFKVKTILKVGSPEEVIEETAKSEEVDLIVLGLNKHSRAYRFLIGSVADKVIRKTTIPVLLIPNE